MTISGFEKKNTFFSVSEDWERFARRRGIDALKKKKSIFRLDVITVSQNLIWYIIICRTEQIICLRISTR